MTDVHDDEGRRLYKARGPDGEVAWVDHDELWRLQQDQAARVRRDHARRRRTVLLALAGLVGVVLAALLFRVWSASKSLETGTATGRTPVARESGPAPEGPPPPSTGPPAAAASPTAGETVSAVDGEEVPTGSGAMAGRPAPEIPEGDAGSPPESSPVGRVADTVAGWAAAWTRQDVAAYLAGYAAEFRSADGLSRSSWERLRRERLLSPTSIRVEIEELEIALGEEGRAEARFVQSYSSPDYTDVVRKTLELVERDGRWLIVSERVTPL